MPVSRCPTWCSAIGERDHDQTEDQEKQRDDRYGAKNQGRGDAPSPDLSLGIAAQARATAARTTPTVLSRTPPAVDPDAPPMNISPSQKKSVSGLTDCPVDGREASLRAETLWKSEASNFRSERVPASAPPHSAARKTMRARRQKHAVQCQHDLGVEHQRPPRPFPCHIGENHVRECTKLNQADEHEIDPDVGCCWSNRLIAPP